MNDIKKIICCCTIILCALAAHAQKTKTPNISLIDTARLNPASLNKVCIKELLVTGTKKTKIYIVYREIQFKKGSCG